MLIQAAISISNNMTLMLVFTRVLWVWIGKGIIIPSKIMKIHHNISIMTSHKGINKNLTVSLISQHLINQWIVNHNQELGIAKVHLVLMTFLKPKSKIKLVKDINISIRRQIGSSL